MVFLFLLSLAFDGDTETRVKGSEEIKIADLLEIGRENSCWDAFSLWLDEE